jgi:hypothetical protein
MASAITYLNITEHQVRQFLDALLEKHHKGAAKPTYVSGTAAAEAPAAAAAAAAAPLRLHPRVDAVHPLGEAHSSRELEAAISMYKQVVKDSYFVIDDIMVQPDKALITGHQIVSSRFASLPALLPLPHRLQQMAAEYLPQLKAGKVPTAIQLRFGKSDMGDPVVTHLSLIFSLLSVLLPHLALLPWQDSILQEVKPQLVRAVLSAGGLASVLEDVGTSLSATVRASTAVFQATVGRLVSELKEKFYSSAGSTAERVGSRDLNGAHG